MKISIVIPCYNSYKFMSNCLITLEKQSVDIFEVIIVDDYSTDNSYNKLLQYQKNTKLKMKVLKLNKNSGPGIARNKGIKEAKGEYILFCDSDDWYEQNFIEILLKNIEKNSEIILYDYNKIIRNKKSKANGLERFDNNYTKNDFIANAEQSLCCMCIKKSLFNEIEIPNLYNGEDVAIVPILLSKAKKITFIKESLYNYYFRENSSSNKVSKKIPNQLLKAFEYIEENLFDVDNDVKEFLGIKIVLYGVTLNLYKLEEKEEVKEIISNFENKYKEWHKNKYIKNLSRSKKIYLYCLRKKFFIINFLFAKLHEKILNF